jgi:hypothetical protein
LLDELGPQVLGKRAHQPQEQRLLGRGQGGPGDAHRRERAQLCALLA